MTKKLPWQIPVNTVISKTEPLSDKELNTALEKQKHEWFKKTVPILLKISDQDRKLAKHLCQEVSDHFSSDDELGPLIKKRISIDRLGKKKGRRTKWNITNLEVLLHEFAAMIPKHGRKKTIELLTEIHKTTKIEDLISRARRTFRDQQNTLPAWVRRVHYPE